MFLTTDNFVCFQFKAVTSFCAHLFNSSCNDGQLLGAVTVLYYVESKYVNNEYQLIKNILKRH